MLNDNSSRRDGEPRRRENRRSKPEGASQNEDSDIEGIYLGLNDTSHELAVDPVYTGRSGRNSQPTTETVYEGLDEHKRQPTTDPVYTCLPNKQYEEATITFNED